MTLKKDVRTKPEISQAQVQDLFKTLQPLQKVLVREIGSWIKKNKIPHEAGKIITTRALAGLTDSVVTQLARARLKEIGFDCDSSVGQRFLKRFAKLIASEERRQQTA